MEKIFKIYKLLHPLSNKIYIGKTYDIKKRFSHHLSEKRINKRTSWIKSLKKKYNDIPFIEIIQDNIVGEDWANSYEKCWIEYYRKNYGRELILNMTDGGDGQTGFKFTKEQKIKMSISHKGHKPINGFKKGQRPNIATEFKKGQIPLNSFSKGHKPKNRRFSEMDILNIYKLYSEGFSFRKLSKQFKIDHSCISDIINKKSYTEISRAIQT